MNKTKTLKMKLIYIIAAIAMLAMLIPAMAIPVSAADGYSIVLTTLDGEPDGGYDIAGSHVIATLDPELPQGYTANWTMVPNSPQDLGGHIVGNPGPAASSVEVVGETGQYSIEVTIYDDEGEYVSTATVTKKWANIKETIFSGGGGTSTLYYSEDFHGYFAMQSITDCVMGTFPSPSGPEDNPIQGVVLHWFLFDSSADVSQPADMEAWYDLVDYYEGLYDDFSNWPSFVSFVDPPFDFLGPMTTTLTGPDGQGTVYFGAWDREAVKIVVIPEYPNNLQKPVDPEFTSWTFNKAEFPVVPQVRWIGEKIVLERYYGVFNSGALVHFGITSGKDGSKLIAFGPAPVFPFGTNLVNSSTNDSVWTNVRPNGMASVILTSDEAQQVVVDAEMYGRVGTDSKFNTYFLKFETINLSDVNGKRDGHYEGVWTPYNPYNKDFPYTYPVDEIDALENDPILTQTLNVSQDALERVQVRGWFEGVDQSTRPAALQDTQLADKVFDFDYYNPPDVDEGYTPVDTLPAYRWVLPDDWALLAGGTNKWTVNSRQWDIMSDPSGIVRGSDPYGPFDGYGYPVIGPFAPGIEMMDAEMGWSPYLSYRDMFRNIKTVVPDNALNAWDAPMPPAKILLEIMDGNGYFKWTDKADVYQDVDGLTNPFYYALIPAHWAITAYGGDSAGCYDWASFGNNNFFSAMGPYTFWKLINTPRTDDESGYPTAVEVYSDNHGEAMAWLNGDHYLYLQEKGFAGGESGVDIQAGTIVGTTEVQATAYYPYARVEKYVSSNTVEKTWLWGGMILGVDGRDDFADGTYSNSSINVLSVGQVTITNTGDPDVEWDDRGTSDKHMAFIWACDRDGLQKGVLGTEIEWIIQNAELPPVGQDNTPLNSDYNDIMLYTTVDKNGFLTNTQGKVGIDRQHGSSVMRAPTEWEAQLFSKNWPDLNPNNFAVAGIEVYSVQMLDITITAFMTSTDFGYEGWPNGRVYYTINIPYYYDPTTTPPTLADYPLDDPILAGDANFDGVVDVGDIVAVERMILGLDAPDVNADANSNGSIDMGDVVKIIRIVRHLD